MNIRLFPIAAAGLLSGALLFAAPAVPEPGVALSIERGGKSDVFVAPNFWLHVAEGETPTPFIAPGPFTATFRGFVSVELRSIHSFQAEVNGSLTLDINGREALRAEGDGAMTEPGGRVRLNKGPNEFVLNYTPAATGEPHVRLFWVARDSHPQPIPQAAITHGPDEALRAAQLRARGRALFIEHRCANCHAVGAGGIAELSLDAPAFTGIGSRRQPAWLAQWLADPRAERSAARMPSMFHGGEAVVKAEAVGAFLATLTDPDLSLVAEPADDASLTAGRELYTELRCDACHGEPGATGTDAERISLAHVPRKFTPGALAGFLRSPNAHFRTIRMPDFALTSEEAGKLAALLKGDGVASAETAPRPELAPLGRELVQTSGCLNCHALKLESRFRTRSAADLASWEQGCLAVSEPAGTGIPHFGFSEEERAALQAFAAEGLESLSRHVDSEYAARQVEKLNCAGCHDGRIDLVPPLELLGGKLRPEYAREIIAGRIANKPRPWIAARMPGFPAYAEGIARGLANLHGFPATSSDEPPVDEGLAEIGYRLVGAEGGFSCISCHGIGPAGMPQVFESAGVNFALTADRLRHDYFVRWMLNPLAVDPSSKMPAFFDEQGRSPLFDVFEGDGLRQIEAMWHYFRQRDAMKIPPGAGGRGAQPERREFE